MPRTACSAAACIYALQQVALLLLVQPSVLPPTCSLHFLDLAKGTSRITASNALSLPLLPWLSGHKGAGSSQQTVVEPILPLCQCYCWVRRGCQLLQYPLSKYQLYQTLFSSTAIPVSLSVRHYCSVIDHVVSFCCALHAQSLCCSASSSMKLSFKLCHRFHCSCVNSPSSGTAHRLRFASSHANDLHHMLANRT